MNPGPNRATSSNYSTVASPSRPSISAVDGRFLHGRWFFAIDGGSPKARQFAARPAISASYTPRDGLGVFCHGQAHRLERGSVQFEASAAARAARRATTAPEPNVG
jgi:hypothetical protein